MKCVLCSKHADIKTRKRILKFYIWTTLSYGSETRTLSNRMIKSVNATEMWFYRKMQKISWTEKVKNDEVLKQMST
jgi:hypothetical protein